MASDNDRVHDEFGLFRFLDCLSRRPHVGILMIEYILIGFLVGGSLVFIINSLRKQITVGETEGQCDKCDPS